MKTDERAGVEIVTLTAADGHQFEAFCAKPQGSSKGGVVVLHAVFGLAEAIAVVCARWAEAGYTAVAPALYDRLSPHQVHPYTEAGVQGGVESYAALSQAQIFADVLACADQAGGLARTAISGFCTGGSWAWRAAAHFDFAAQVNFYGSHVHLEDHIHLAPRCPTIIHYGDGDFVVPLAQIERIKDLHPSVEMHIYEGAGHAFLNPDQAYYKPEAARLAWARSIDFMDRHLARG